VRSACLPGDGPEGVCEDLLYEDQGIAGTVAVIDCPLPALRCEATGASNVAI